MAVSATSLGHVGSREGKGEWNGVGEGKGKEGKGETDGADAAVGESSLGNSYVSDAEVRAVGWAALEECVSWPLLSGCLGFSSGQF